MEKLILYKDRILLVAIIIMDIIAFGIPSFSNPIGKFAPGSFIFFIGVIIAAFYHLIYKKKASNSP